MDLRAKKTFKDFFLQASIICLVSTRKPVEGGYDVIGASQPIRAAPGDDVILPCWVSPEWNATRKTVEWSRLNLTQNSSTQKYVLLYKGFKVDKDAMMESYILRVSLLPGNLSVGNLSLKLTNVTVNDSGSYKCFLPNLKKFTIVQFIVDSSAAGNLNTSEYNWLHVLWVLLVGIPVSFYLFKKRKRWSQANLGQNCGEGESSLESFLQPCPSVHHNPVKVHFS